MTGCIEWLGYKAPNGYGRMFSDGKKCLAHRVAYKEANGCTWEEMDGLVIMQTCDNRACINPDHLVLATQKQNHTDMISKGRQRGGRKPIGLDDLAILHSWQNGKRKADIARELNCSRAAITYAIQRALTEKS